MVIRSYAKDRKDADEYIPQMFDILNCINRRRGGYCVAPSYLDNTEGVDAIWKSPIKPGHRTALRVRNESVAFDYPGQITLRNSRPSGVETEIHKVRRGTVADCLYAYKDDKTRIITGYIYYCLETLVYIIGKHPELLLSINGPFSGIKKNYDGTTFRWFDIFRLSEDYPGLIISNEQPQ